MQNSQQMGTQPQSAPAAVQQPGAQMAPATQQQAQAPQTTQQGVRQIKDWASI